MPTPTIKLAKKCEKFAMEIKLQNNPTCLVCGNKATTCHHYVPKSLSAYLRCDDKNLIPICNSCHFAHHTRSDPRIHEAIEKKLGKKWLKYINENRRKIIKNNVGYWEKIWQTLIAKKMKNWR